MASPEHHRSTVDDLLAKAKGYGPSAPARLAVLAEAQIHATLYLAEITAAIAAPQRIVVNQTIPSGDFKPTPAPVFVPNEPPVAPADLGKPAKSRTRKAPATAKETSE